MKKPSTTQKSHDYQPLIITILLVACFLSTGAVMIQTMAQP